MAPRRRSLRTRRGGGARLLAVAALCALAVTACGGAEFDAWARDICGENDALDREAEQKLATKQEDFLRDINYLDKLHDILARKKALKQRVDDYPAPITRNALRNKLSIALNNSIRYLTALEQQYHVAKERWEEMSGDEDVPKDPYDATNVLRQLTTQQSAYSVDPRELLMKRQYEKLYAEVRAELGLDTAGF